MYTNSNPVTSHLLKFTNINIQVKLHNQVHALIPWLLCKKLFGAINGRLSEYK